MVLTHKFLLCFAFSFLCCLQRLMQLTVWIQLDMGHRKEGHGLRLSFDLDLIPDFNLVTRIEIKYKCMDFESFLTF